MGGYIGSGIGSVANAAERKQTYSITTSTTSLTGLAYTPTKVHVFHNGVRLVDGTDYTATNGTSITLTNAAQNGDEVVVISYPSFQTSDTVSAANGGTFSGNIAMSGTLGVTGATTLSGGVSGNILPSADNTSDLGSTSKRFQDLHLSGGVSFDENPSLVTGNVASKTLDDYEEGTWTASLDGITPASQFCRYIKVGSLVHIGAQIAFPVTGSGNNAMVGGIPFTVANTDAARAGIVVSWHNASSSNGLQFLLTNNGTNGFFYLSNSIKSYANMSGVTFYFGGTYIAA